MKTKIVLLLMAAAFLCQVPAFAETIEGKVTGLDRTEKTLSVMRVDPATSAEESVNLFVTEKTQYQGDATRLDDLEAGNEVVIDAGEKDRGRGFEATRVEKKGKAAHVESLYL
ncbi:MAG TPA: hypothetical protein VL688_08190 [Verrucomicrobiae bacterium]|jgi:hypothetical protein|nr:hypothetical protein [Verrucomicrobiae bacterium]